MATLLNVHLNVAFLLSLGAGISAQKLIVYLQATSLSIRTGVPTRHALHWGEYATEATLKQKAPPFSVSYLLTSKLSVRLEMLK